MSLVKRPSSRDVVLCACRCEGRGARAAAFRGGEALRLGSATFATRPVARTNAAMGLHLIIATQGSTLEIAVLNGIGQLFGLESKCGSAGMRQAVPMFCYWGPFLSTWLGPTNLDSTVHDGV